VSRRRPGLGLLAAAGAVVIALAVLASMRLLDLGRSGQPGQAVPPGQASAYTGTGNPGAVRHTGGESLVPVSGAYLGAYVNPGVYSPAATIGAVQSFERLLGRPLDLVHVYHPWLSPFPDAADKYFVRQRKVLLLTWGGDADTRQIIAGRYDALIRARARAVKRLGRPIMLEYRHEMDRPNLQRVVHGPADYIAAWDHIRSIFTAVGADNVNWVWCPTAWGFADGRAQQFYPGDNEVDWICADAYAVSPSQPLSSAAGAFLSWAAQHPKPVIIGEFAVDGTPGQWAGWLAEAAQLVRKDQQIKAFAYFDGNGLDSQGRPFAYSLGNNPAAISEFSRLLAQPYFRPAPSYFRPAPPAA